MKIPSLLYVVKEGRKSPTLYHFLNQVLHSRPPHRWPVWRIRYSDWLRVGQSGRGEIFHTRPDRPWGSPGLLYNGYCFYFPEVKQTWHCVEKSPQFAPKLKMSRAIPLNPSWAFMDSYRENLMAFSSQLSGLPKCLLFRFQDQNLTL